MKTILVVDDEPKITQLVRDYLERAGYGVLVAHDGKLALSLAKTEKPDMIVLDLGLPQLDGLDFTREFRKSSNAPIIMLTARAEETKAKPEWAVERHSISVTIIRVWRGRGLTRWRFDGDR